MSTEKALSPKEAVTSVFSKYATFSGRATRSEYWWFALFQTVVYVLLFAITIGIAAATPVEPGDTPPIVAVGGIVYFLIALGLALPNIALLVRRLHDAGLSGWLYFVTVIPFFGAIATIIFAVLPSNPDGAQYDRVEYPGDPEPTYSSPSTLS
jgi:uncharacterized membrane protein YhaH (DUF805 family)